MRTCAPAVALVVGLSLSACASLEDVAPGTTVTCSSAAECPSGLVCNHGRCANPNALDTTPPDLVSFAVSQPRVRAGQSFTVSVEVTEALEAAPTVSLGLQSDVGGPVYLDCSATAARAFACTHLATGHENGDVGGDIFIHVGMTDLAGNYTLRSSVGTVTFDFTPPSPTLASVAYFPAATNPLPSVQRAMAGTVVQVAVSANESFSTPPVPGLVARLGGTAFPLTFVPGGLDEKDALFETNITEATPDGDYALEVAWSDAVGNVGTAAVSGAVVRVKTSKPSLSVDQDALVFVRSAWGNAAQEVRGAYPIPAGPYFALEPSDALTTTAFLPAGSLTLDGTATPSRVIVQLGPDATALAVGVLQPEPDGRFPRQSLFTPDVPAVWLVGVDDAGNRTASVRVRDVEWVATPNAPAFGSSPHVVTSTGYSGTSRTQARVTGTVVGAAVSGADGTGALASAAAAWEDAGTGSEAPGARARHAMAYDAARGRVVLFGGENGTGFLGDTWEWEGTSWTRAASTGPSARAMAAMTYDSERGRVFLFGGVDGFGVLEDTWEWDGARWSQVALVGPGARSGHVMAYDVARARVVLFGGVAAADTWEWDGTAWAQVATTGPSSRSTAAMAYDGVRGRVVLFGGFARDETGSWAYVQDTWEWDGIGWTLVATGGPSPRDFAAMVFDCDRERVVLFGGSASGGPLEDTWEWNGTTWSPVPQTGPGGRAGHAMAYDAARRRTVLVGGYSEGFPTGDTWERSDGWSRRSPVAPPARYGHAMAFDEFHGRVVLFGGRTEVGAVQETWAWDGAGWTLVATNGPSARYGHAMAYDSARRRVVLFGGFDTAPLQDTWEWEEASGWTQVATTGPAPRHRHALAYDSVRGRVVLFGGAGSDPPPQRLLQDTWEWDGLLWTQRATSGPSGSLDPRGARWSHAMAYDAANERVVLFGGDGDDWLPMPSEETWTWDGAAWSVAATSGPSRRYAHAMAYDSVRDRVVLVGGSRGPTSEATLRDSWEWDGHDWAQVAGLGPSARADHAAAFDSARNRTVVFGGSVPARPDAFPGQPPVLLGNTWTLDAAPEHRPALQFAVATPPFGVDPGRVRQVLVRSFAGATSAAGGSTAVGAELFGWATRGPANEPGGWDPLEINTIGLTGSPPQPLAPPASELCWKSSSPEEARRYLVERDGLTFQVRSRGGAGPAPDGAAVAVDYIEVRVRYTAP